MSSNLQSLWNFWLFKSQWKLWSDDKHTFMTNSLWIHAKNQLTKFSYYAFNHATHQFSRKLYTVPNLWNTRYCSAVEFIPKVFNFQVIICQFNSIQISINQIKSKTNGNYFVVKVLHNTFNITRAVNQYISQHSVGERHLKILLNSFFNRNPIKSLIFCLFCWFYRKTDDNVSARALSQCHTIFNAII